MPGLISQRLFTLKSYFLASKPFGGRHAVLGMTLGIGSENNGHKERYKRNNGP